MAGINKTAGVHSDNSQTLPLSLLPFVLFALFLMQTNLPGCNRSMSSETIHYKDLTGKTSDGTKHLVLETFETKQGVFELGVAPCTSEDGCPFEVRWREKGKPVSSLALYAPIPNHTITKSTLHVDDSWGWKAGTHTWDAGEENSSVYTAAQLLHLDGNTVGLLVWQQFGFDHVHRAHRLAIPKDGRLEFLWEYTELAGPVWTAAVATPPSSLTFFYTFSYHGELPNTNILAVTRLSYDKNKGKLVPAPPATVAAAALIAGDFESPDSAHDYQLNDPKQCYQEYIVLSSDSFAGIHKDRSALVRVFVHREDAENEK